MSRLKILVSAYACNPNKGSEEGVGWGWVTAIARYHNLYVVTAEFHRTDIERASREQPELFSHLRFFYVPHRPWHYAPTKGWLSIEGSVLKPVMNYAYRLWQRDAYKLARRLHEESRFDLAHQLTYVGFRFPGHLWKLDIPFVWGPIGGLENTPWKFLPGLGASGCIYYVGRNILNTLHKKFLSAPKKAFRKARGSIIAATEGIRREIRRWYGEESEVICEIGPPSTIAADHSVRAAGEVLKLSWSGQHLPGKALPLLLRALVNLPVDVKWQLDILGEGPRTMNWQRLAGRLGIHGKCRWHGQIARSEAIKIVHQSHVFVITSLKDLTSTVLLEAFSQGVPVICPDHCGFTNVVTEDCGIKVPIVSPRQFENDLASAIKSLADDEQKRRHLAKGALQRIGEFSWKKKAEQTELIYRRAVPTSSLSSE
jgi:glycosyltransferase involved in cell wall biosynthesis